MFLENIDSDLCLLSNLLLHIHLASSCFHLQRSVLSAFNIFVARIAVG